MKQILIAVLTVFSISSVSASKLSGSYGGDQCPKFYIGLYHHGHYECIDSIRVDAEGRFSIILPDNRKGILLIACQNNKNASEALNKADNTSSLQFVYDGQDITYETSWRWHNSDLYLRMPKGGEITKLIGRLVKKQQELFERLASLETVMDKTDRSSSFFTIIDNEYMETIKNYNRELQNVTSSAVSGSMFETVLMCLAEPETPSGLQGEQRVEWLRGHLFDFIDLNNPLVYDCPFFMDRLHQYLYLWQPKGLVSKSFIEQGQLEGKKILLDKVKSAPEQIQEAMKRVLEAVQN